MAMEIQELIFSNVYYRKLKGPGVPNTVLRRAPDTCDIKVVYKQRIITKSANPLWTSGKLEIVVASTFIYFLLMEVFKTIILPTVLILSFAISQGPVIGHQCLLRQIKKKVPVVLINIYLVLQMFLQNLHCKTPLG